jgi:metallo-beta-lactamase class B
MTSYPPPSSVSAHKISRRTLLAGLGIGAACALVGRSAFAFDESPDWTTPLDPFRIAGNLYYVGSRDLASYLVATPEGHILINSNLVSSPPLIRASVEKLGFRFKDVKILLLSQAHFDHGAGAAEILKETGAKYMVMDGDVADVESGGKTNFFYGSRKDMQFPAAKVDRTLHDGDTVSLGGSVLTAHKTAGHTMGCTTWTMSVREGGKSWNAVILGGPTLLPGYNLIDDPRYPKIAADYAAEFRLLKSLPCDIFLGAHGGYFDMLSKLDKLKQQKPSSLPGPFVDPTGYQASVAEDQQAFEAELKQQQTKHAAKPAVQAAKKSSAK